MAKIVANNDVVFAYEGKDKKGKNITGEIKAKGIDSARVQLRKQNIKIIRISKSKQRGRVKDEDICLFTRQLATMLKAGVPLLQAFDIVGKGHDNPAVSRLLLAIKTDIETGSSLESAFKKYPLLFDDLFCNLIGAGEQAGILDDLLDRLATYKEKTQALKSKIKSAMFYPLSILVIAIAITSVIMIWVIPSFKKMFENFNSELPLPTIIVVAISDFFVDNWWIIFPVMFGSIYYFFYTWKRSKVMQRNMDIYMLKLPIFGELLKKAAIARWTRTLATMFAAGVNLVEALDSVAGAAGNAVYGEATLKIKKEVSSGENLTVAMQNSKVFPNVVLQMVAIGEEAGALDNMLSKVASIYEGEVDTAVEGLSSLMEPVIMVVLGGLIGGLVVAMYLPIFKMGQAVG